MTDEQKQQFTRRITNANRTEMIVILLEMVLTYTKDAGKSLDKQDMESFKREIDRAKVCLKELQNSVNFDNELGMNYFEIYLFLRRELSRADVTGNKTALDNVCSIVGEIYETYRKMSEADTSRPIMENAQTVYAGLTYGKNSLNESLAGRDIDRGFRA